MRKVHKALIAGSLVASSLVLGGAAAAPEVKQVVTGPVAQYWVSASTNSGFTLGGGKPSMSDMMGMMGGGSNVSHSLILQLGSNQVSVPEGNANHTPPAGLGTGVLPLYFKTPGPGKPTPDGPTEQGEYEPPKGKILLFWGCGEKAGPNQPVVIDLSKIMDPAERAGMIEKLSTLGKMPASERNIYSSKFKSYAEWPNSKNRAKSIKEGASLVGAHTVVGNFAPAINFNLTATQDFLAPFEVTQNSGLPSGAVGLKWKPIPQAKAYFASVIGGSGDGGNGATAVFWNSADIQTGMMMVMVNYLSPADIDRLLGQKVLLPPTTTSCAVPAEVLKAAPQGLYNLSAFGPEVNFAYPPRPTDPKVAWNIEWTTKVRYRSAVGGLLVQDMGGNASEEGGAQPKKKKGGLMGELIKGGLGL